MIKQNFKKILHKAERGQAIILVAFALIGLVAMVGLVVDTGILLIEYGKLKRGVDAAAVASAQQYRLSGNVLDKTKLENAARNFLQLNQSTDITNVTIHSCEDAAADRPPLCNPDPIGHPDDNRKLVEVIASKFVTFGFLRVIGIPGTSITANAVGEAATIDLVLVIDTSASMAFETDPAGNPTASDPLEDPSVCNLNNTCQPMKAVKDAALGFIETLYFKYDRVAIVTMTSQNPGGTRGPLEVLALTSNKATVTAAINNLKVFEPRDCDGSDTLGTCLKYNDGTGIFEGALCQIHQNHYSEPTADPSSCPSSNVGGALDLARVAFTADPARTRLDAFWVVVTLLGGPANATNATVTYPNGFCPQNTWTYMWDGLFCQDKLPQTRHASTDALVPHNNLVSGAAFPVAFRFMTLTIMREILLINLQPQSRDKALPSIPLGWVQRLEKPPIVMITTRMELRRFHRQKLYSNILPNARAKVLML
ncbi:MAG: VWA domain-containing protein [Anaerolineales bacterium]|nr:VWA domain-containing protein [Anaerolineales bacterium]